ncbi:response regulator [Limnobacter humi]|uniref:Response regulator n=1 Tax=Limnobacter humi TaxID=1778671 RepID=A0ABT1WJ21_9BURK|nr:response regulator [Limnobacter humi]MCQ8897528.1 response regulator [Limnobacter humi]
MNSNDNKEDVSFLESLPRIDKFTGIRESEPLPRNNAFKDSLPLQGTTVLILDRSAPSTKHLKDELAQMGSTQFDVVNNPNDFFRYVLERNYDFVFCDYNIDERRNGAVVMEELRTKQAAHFGSSIIVVSGDRSSSALVGMMEFEPEAFLIKPFSAEELSKRVIRIHARRMVLKAALKAKHYKQYDAALVLCDEVLRDFPQYDKDVFRLKVEVLLQAKRHDEAEALLKNHTSLQAPGWIDLTLARLSRIKGDKGEAESWLRKAITYAPHFIQAHDELADLLIESSRVEEALSVLEGLSAVVAPSIKRLRCLSELADLQGYDDKKRNYLNRLIDRTVGTTLVSANDFYRLAQAQIDNQRPDEAYKVLGRMRSVIDAAEAEMAENLLIVYGHYLNNDVERARADLEVVVKKQISKGIQLCTEGRITLMTLCARLGLLKKAESLRQQLLKTTASTATVLRIHRAMQTPAAPAKAAY